MGKSALAVPAPVGGDPRRANAVKDFSIRPAEEDPQANLVTFLSMVCSMVAMAMKSRELAVVGVFLCLISFGRKKAKDSYSQMLPGVTACLMCLFLVYKNTAAIA